MVPNVKKGKTIFLNFVCLFLTFFSHFVGWGWRGKQCSSDIIFFLLTWRQKVLTLTWKKRKKGYGRCAWDCVCNCITSKEREKFFMFTIKKQSIQNNAFFSFFKRAKTIEKKLFGYEKMGIVSSSFFFSHCKRWNEERDLFACRCASFCPFFSILSKKNILFNITFFFFQHRKKAINSFFFSLLLTLLPATFQ